MHLLEKCENSSYFLRFSRSFSPDDIPVEEIGSVFERVLPVGSAFSSLYHRDGTCILSFRGTDSSGDIELDLMSDEKEYFYFFIFSSNIEKID